MQDETVEQQTAQELAPAPSLPGALAAKIALAMRHTRRVPLDGFNNYDKYHYARNATILEHCGAGMAEAGLAVIPVLMQHKVDRESGKDNSKYTCWVEMDFFIIGDPGETFTARWSGYGDSHRTPAMALKVAITNCHVSFVSKLFMVGADDDPVDDAAQGGERAGRRANRNQYQPSPNGNGANGNHPQEYPQEWKTPVDAQAWYKVALEATTQGAQQAWLETVRTCGGYSDREKGKVFAAFYTAHKPAESMQTAPADIPA